MKYFTEIHEEDQNTNLFLTIENIGPVREEESWGIPF